MPTMGDLLNQECSDGSGIIDFFNSDNYWTLREKIVTGELIPQKCKGCQYHKIQAWTEDELLELKSVVNSIEKSLT